MGPIATSPLGSSAVAWLAGKRLPAIHVPLVEPWSVTESGFSVTVACWPETLACCSTTCARAASRPKTIWPAAGGSEPGCISISARAGCVFGTGVCPTMNWVRKSKGCDEPGAMG